MATVTLHQLKTTFYSYLGECYTGRATGMNANNSAMLDANTLIGYTGETWPAKVEGQQLFCQATGGATGGNLYMIGKFDRSDGAVYPSVSFVTNMTNGDLYEIWGTAIHAGDTLSNLMNDVLRQLKPVTDTQVTIVSNQRMYDVSTVVQSRRDIRGVYLRLLDPSAVEPYRIRDMSRGLEWEAYDRGGGGTESVTLELMNALTLNTATTQLWVRGETTFTPIVVGTAQLNADASTTFEADYRDWLAWEFVLELSRRKQSMGNYDKPRWDALQTRAIEELRSHRQRWLAAREPIQIATWP